MKNENSFCTGALQTSGKQERVWSFRQVTAKHIIQRVYNIYLSNNQFKHAMYMCGFKEKDPRALNWQYFIKKSSAALNLSQAYHDGIPARYDITKYFKEDK